MAERKAKRTRAAPKRKVAAPPTSSEKPLLDAIESLTEGFALFDADDRLHTCNARQQRPT